MGGALGGGGGLDVGGVEMELALSVVGGAGLQFFFYKVEDLVVGEGVDFGAFGLFLGEEQAGGDALGAGGEPHGDA